MPGCPPATAVKLMPRLRLYADGDPAGEDPAISRPGTSSVDQRLRASSAPSGKVGHSTEPALGSEISGTGMPAAEKCAQQESAPVALLVAIGDLEQWVRGKRPAVAAGARSHFHFSGQAISCLPALVVSCRRLPGPAGRAVLCHFSNSRYHFKGSFCALCDGATVMRCG